MHASKVAPLCIRPRDLDALERALHCRTTLQGTVLKQVKGGLVVDVVHAKGFVPSSLFDVRRTNNLQSRVGQVIGVHVVRLLAEQGILTLSRRSVVEEEIGRERAKLLQSLTVGSRHCGIVCALTNFGAFVDFGGVQGLIPLGAMSNKMDVDPCEFVSPGQKVNVTVKSMTSHDGRIRIGLSKPLSS